MAARRLCKKIPVRFPETPLTEVVQLVRFALPDSDNREPAAALATATAGAGRFGDLLTFHTTKLDAKRCKDNGSGIPGPGSAAGKRKGQGW